METRIITIDVPATVARKLPELLGFPVTVVGNRTLIPRKSFIRHIGEEAAE